MSQYGTVQNTFLFSYIGMMFITIFLVIKLVRDATGVIHLEKEMLRKKKPQHNKKALKKSASIEMIHKRSRRFSSMEGNENSSFGIGDDIV